ncbi:uncharacterized protein LOC135687680 isoform X2 [Rhopilema esculentum]|uniref:uncharacterized protein LOC135687680 isoform X2 n=1 Tax=Rhopilema esculentum TaxID=499914 RepID=UPI0031E246D3
MENRKCLKQLEKVVTNHIAHRYSSKMGMPTSLVFAEMIYEDENDTSGMQKVKTKLHGYAPCNDSVNPVEFVEQGVVGDQLTVECGVSCLFQLENCVTEKERLDGLYLEVADFHAGMKFLQV